MYLEYSGVIMESSQELSVRSVSAVRLNEGEEGVKLGSLTDSNINSSSRNCSCSQPKNWKDSSSIGGVIGRSEKCGEELDVLTQDSVNGRPRGACTLREIAKGLEFPEPMDSKTWQIFPSYSERKPGFKDVIKPGSLQRRNVGGTAQSFLLGLSCTFGIE